MCNTASDWLGAELLERGVLRVEHVLEDLEAEADVGADDQPVGHRADDDGRETHQQ